MNEAHVPETPSAGSVRTGQRRIRVLLTALLAVVAVIGTWEVVTTGSASASTVNAVLTITSADGTGTYVPSGASTTPFTVTLPPNASCSGDTANDGYHVYSYLVPEGTDLSSLTFTGSSPPAQSFGFVNNAGVYYGPVNTAVTTGQIINIPNNFEWAPLATQDGLLPTLLADGSTPGTWEAGLLCSNSTGAVTDNWNTQIKFTSSGSDPSGFVWSAVPGPSGDQVSTITSASTASFTEGTAGTFTVTATGTPAPAITESGALPTGVTFAAGVLSGTATATGSFPITFTATNGIGNPATQSFTLTVNSAGTAPTITSANHATFTEGTAGSFTVTATGSPAPTITESGALPTGVSFAAGVLSGTPTATGSFPITFTASNGVGTAASQSFTLTVNSAQAAPAITSAASTTFTTGSAGTFTVTTTGNPTAALSENGTLPTGVTFVDNGNGTGTLAGTPGTGTAGSYPITIGATNGVSPNASQSFTLTVNSSGTAPTITSANHATFTEGTAGSFTVTATGSPTPTITESGALPTGVTFTGGVLSGTATATGSFPITFTATNGVSPNATQSFTLTVSSSGTAPTITSANHATFTEGTAGSFTVTATGSPTPTITESGALPTGVTFAAGVLSGTPTAAGSFPITFTATNGIGTPATQSFTLTVNPPGTGPTLSLHKSKDLVGNYAEKVSGAGWAVHGATSVTLYECAGPTYVKTLCDSSNVVHVPLGTGAKSGAFKDAVITLVTGDIAKKTSCGLAQSAPCSIVATDGVGDSVSAPLGFRVPEVTVRKTDDVVGNSSDTVKAKGFPIGDTVVAQECDRTVRVPSTVATHCDASTQISGTAGPNGRVSFSPTGLKILVGTAYSDAAGRSCSFGHTCAIAVTDSTNPVFDFEIAITTADPSATVGRVANVRPGQVDAVRAVGFPAGDTVVAEECDRSVTVPATTAAHCDQATKITGTASASGRVAFSPGGVQVQVGPAYSDAAGGRCAPGRSCAIAVSDSSDPTIGLKLRIGLAS
jgi:hypothetical protein